MIDISYLSYNIGKRIIFENASAFIGKGQKVGFVGLNGTGKTTLFRLILGKILPDGGSINISKGVRISSVEQEIADTEENLLNFVLYSDKYLKNLYSRLKQNLSGTEIAEIYEKLDALGAHSASARASAILSGLGFKNADLQRKLEEFSGGWQMRAALAAALFAPGDCLLLDEPTNHLDLESAIWLENALKKMDKTLLIISHDRNILNKICDKIIFIDEYKLKTYGGNYDAFERTRNLQTEQIVKEAARHEETLKHLQSFVDRFRYKASKAKQAQSRVKMIERMGSAPKIPAEKSSRFHFPCAAELNSYLFTFENVSCGYGDKTVLKDINITIAQDDKIALLGANGNGKSTFAKLLSGRILPQSGKITRARKLKTAYFAQYQTEEFDADKTPFETAKEVMYEAKEKDIYTHLGRFGLEKSKADTQIAKLSGGEKSRLLLSMITVQKPHILILDEPTNHLDILSRRALIEALNNYAGAVVLITHDFHIIESVCDRLVLVERGAAANFDGDIEDYKNYVMRSCGKECGEAADAPQSRAREKRKTSAALRAQSAPLRKKLKAVEEEISKLNIYKTDLENRLISSFKSDISIELAFVNKKISDAEENWLKLSSKLEEMSN
ncbi:MAG: ATP-binding cassette domain-containing protein [Elusimicrobiota bacterium]|jgi:ATP-binding cassette subfamily F protein 3|nr:ATP-binding cassette domain-containing protein [Elusimicrobiota bacterium]